MFIQQNRGREIFAAFGIHARGKLLASDRLRLTYYEE